MPPAAWRTQPCWMIGVLGLSFSFSAEVVADAAGSLEAGTDELEDELVKLADGAAGTKSFGLGEGLALALGDSLLIGASSFAVAADDITLLGFGAPANILPAFGLGLPINFDPFMFEDADGVSELFRSRFIVLMSLSICFAIFFVFTDI